MKHCLSIWATVLLVLFLVCLPPTSSAASRRPGADRKSLASLAHTGQVKVTTIGAGGTIGHVADLKIENLTGERLVVPIPAMLLESPSGRNQHYACFHPQDIALAPHETKTVPIDGVCLMRDKPPVPKGVAGELIICDGNPASPRNPDSHFSPKEAGKLVRVAKSYSDAAKKLRREGKFKKMPYTDPKMQDEIVTQWGVWSDPKIAKSTDEKPATKEDLKKTITRQAEKKGPLPPEEKEKLDSGIDEIFKDVQLTGKEAKNLEEPDPFAGVELTGVKAKGSS